MKKGIFSFLLVALLVLTAMVAGAPPAMAQSIGSSWDYLRPNSTGATTYKPTVDTILINKAGATADTSVPFYFNDLVAKGAIYVALKSYSSNAGVLKPPRLEVALLDINGKPFKFNIYRAWALDKGAPDTSATARARRDSLALAVDTVEVKWTTISDSIPASFTMTRSDTFRYVIPYDFRDFMPYAIKIRGVGTADSCKCVLKVTGTKVTAGKTQLNY